MTATQPADKIELDTLLADWYVASVLKKGSTQNILQRFTEALGVHPTLRDLAADRLASLRAIPDQRCFISKVHRDYLERVLNGKTS